MTYEIGVKTQKKLQKCTNENNRNYLYQFVDYMIKSNSTTSTIKNYVSIVVNLYEHLGNINIQSTNIAELERFLTEKYDNIATRNTRIDYLKLFFAFLNENTFIKITIDELLALKKEEDSEDKRSGIALTFNEMIKLRQILKNEEKYEWWLTFELIYYYGLKFKQLTSIDSSIYDPKKGTIKISDKTLSVNPLIRYLIEEENALPKKKLKMSAYQYRISEIAGKINKELLWKDIIKTREQNFLKCPSCNDLFENNPDNWAIYHYQIDDSKWMVCRSCAEGMIINE